MNAYSNIGRAYYFNHQYNEAINAFSTEMKLDPKAYNNIPYIALSYQALGNMAEAKRIEAIAQQYFRDFKLN